MGAVVGIASTVGPLAMQAVLPLLLIMPCVSLVLEVAPLAEMLMWQGTCRVLMVGASILGYGASAAQAALDQMAGIDNPRVFLPVPMGFLRNEDCKSGEKAHIFCFQRIVRRRSGFCRKRSPAGRSYLPLHFAVGRSTRHMAECMSVIGQAIVCWGKSFLLSLYF